MPDALYPPASGGLTIGRQPHTRAHRTAIPIAEVPDLGQPCISVGIEAFETRRHALALCLQKLGPEQRELIARRYEPEASVKALAEAAGTTPKAVSDKLRRIRRALLDCIEQTLKEEAFA